MVRTLTTTATFVSKKVDAYKRTVYCFEIPAEHLDELHDISNKLMERLGLTDEEDFYTPFWGSLPEDDGLDDLIDTKCYIRFTKNTMGEVRNILNGTSCEIVYDLKFYKMSGKNGLSACLKSIST